MKVAIDLRPLQIGHQHRGIGAYLLNLLERLPENDSHSYVFLRYNTSEPLKDFEIDVPGKFEEVVLKKHSFSKHPVRLIQYGVANLLPVYNRLLQHQPDVFFQSDYLLGGPRSSHCRVITVAHDLIPYRFRQIYLPPWRKFYSFRQFKLKSRLRLMLRAWYYEQKYKHGVALLHRSDTIISVSESTADDLTELLQLPRQKIKVIYSAASFRDNSAEDSIRPEVKEAVDNIKQPFIAYVGGTDMRRQIDELVFAFNLYNARVSALALVLCGNEFEIGSTEINPAADKAIKESSYADNIYRLGRITEAEKKYILTKASAFVYPTLYEGFGLPILEAMQCATPVISYKNSAIPEIAGDNALYTDGTGGYAIFLAIQELLNNISTWRQLALVGQKHAEKFNWEKSAQETWGLVCQTK